MNKKQRNRKSIKQIKRNRIINKRYSSTVKTLFKYFSNKVKNINSQNLLSDSTEQITKTIKKDEIFSLVKNLYSMIDKATKKSVMHKNTAARKKSRISKIYSSIS